MDYASLFEEYNNVTVLPNGVTKCVDSYGNELYIPANCPPNTAMYSYLPGFGGGGDAWVLRNQLAGENPPQYVVCISATWDRDHLLTDNVDLLAEHGISVDKVFASGFSMSGGKVYASVDHLLTEHPEIDATIAVINSTNDNVVVNDPDSYPALIEHQTAILCVDPADVQYRTQYIKDGVSHGFNMYYLEASSWGHAWFNNDFLTSGFPDYILGYADEHGNSSLNTSRPIEYNLVSIDPITGEKTPVDFEEVLNRQIYIPNLERLKSFDAFDIVDTVVKTDEMGVLSGLSDLSLRSKTGVISSEYEYVLEWANTIRNQIKSSGYLSGFGMQGFRSSEGIPGCIGKYLNAYYSLVSSLLSDLSIETESILSYAQAMVDMDDDIASGVEELGTVSELEFGEELPATDYKPQEDTTEYYGNTDKDKDDDNKLTDDKEKPPVGGNPVAPGGSGTTPPSSNILEYEIEGNCSAIVRYDGDIAQELIYRYAFNSEEEVQKNYDAVLKIYLTNPQFDHLTIRGNDIFVYMKKSYCAGCTKDEMGDILLAPPGERTHKI